jgi:hypothetical protein
MYNSLTCSENLAIPFYLLSIYLFILVIKMKKSINWFLFAGLSLSIANIFRMVGYVILIAYLLYLIIYWRKRKLVSSCALILISFLIPLYCTSSLLNNLGITQYSLWRGSEPSITSVLKGTNVDSNGCWNREDSKLPAEYDFDYKAVENASIDIIKERLTKTPPSQLLNLYFNKFVLQWSFGDFASAYWALDEIGNHNLASELAPYSVGYAQLFYTVVLAFVILGLLIHKHGTKNKEIYLFYIIFCGYGLFYLITEMQPRYGYVVSWVFIILSCSSGNGITLKLTDKINRIKLNKQTKGLNQ